MAHEPLPQGQQNPEPHRAWTIIETDEDLRRALLSGFQGQQAGVPNGAGPAATIAVFPVAGPPPRPQNGAGRSAIAFRPTSRPPVPVLTVCDDGKLEGEVIRIRDYRFVIGRSEGDLRIPLDGRISARHVEITHQFVGGLHRWVVSDLQSTHGLFVRVSKTILTDKAEILVGNGRYRFDVPQAGSNQSTECADHESDQGETQGWNESAGTIRPPALTELVGKEIGNRTILVKPEYWIGTDPGCPICRPDDPFCEPRQVRLYRARRGWYAEHNRTSNGLWLRMPQVTVESTVQFQIGEQRFRLTAQ